MSTDSLSYSFIIFFNINQQFILRIQIMNLQEQKSNPEIPALPQIDYQNQSSSSSQIQPPLSNNHFHMSQRKRSRSQEQNRKSRSRSRDDKPIRIRDSEIQFQNGRSISGQKIQQRVNESQQKLNQQINLVKKGVSKHMSKQIKKKRTPKQYLTDFTDFLPESLLLISKTNITSKIRIGERYQANIPPQPRLLSQSRSMEQWVIWKGSSSQNLPSEDNLNKFKELLGENRNEEQLISMKMRLGRNSWKQVLDYVSNNRSELRRVFHAAQRNRL